MRTKKMKPLRRDQMKDPSNSKLLEVQLVDLGLLQSAELEMEEKKEVVEVVEEEAMEVVEEEDRMRRMTKPKKRFVLLPIVPLRNEL